MPEKLCNGDCKESKPLSEFYFSRGRYASRCKPCISIYKIELYKKRAEKKKLTEEYGDDSKMNRRKAVSARINDYQKD